MSNKDSENDSAMNSDQSFLEYENFQKFYEVRIHSAKKNKIYINLKLISNKN